VIRSLAIVVIVGAISLGGCRLRTAAEERALADSQATSWEAAEAIRLGKDPSGPVDVIQRNTSACAAKLGHPYPAPRTP
jgi:hypothetical protein